MCFNPLVPDDDWRTCEAILTCSRRLKLDEAFRAQTNIDDVTLLMESAFITSMFLQSLWMKERKDGEMPALLHKTQAEQIADFSHWLVTDPEAVEGVGGRWTVLDEAAPVAVQ